MLRSERREFRVAWRALCADSLALRSQKRGGVGGAVVDVTTRREPSETEAIQI